LDDPRIRTFRASGGGVCAARNVALDAARGELVAYLDDDNRMDPHWLKAVVLTFAGFPDARACYGARVIDDEGRLFRGTPAGAAWVHFDPWDAEAVRADNRVDMNAIAHRRSDARFDADLAYYGDWDLLLQLTAGHAPVEVPAVAAYYRTDVPGRMSSTLAPEEIDREYRRVREKLSVD
ncbi:MAG: glycosyltransferase, partial [Actinomycetota bacterium]|nr:glycosyltransferase [Actinomycetota bacterium]